MIIACATLLGGCSAEMSPAIISGGKVPATVSDVVVRTFDVDSPVGLDVDAASSGLGFELRVPQDAASVPMFQLVVSVRAPQGESPLQLTMASDLETLERPTTLRIPRRMLPSGTVPGGMRLSVVDRGGSRRVIAKESLSLTADELVVATPQPLGEWTFAASDAGATENDFAITSKGLATDESLRFEIVFGSQALDNASFDIGLPDTVVKQRTTGNETRFLSAPSGARGTYRLNLLEAPLKHNCKVTPESGLVGGRIAIEIFCAAR